MRERTRYVECAGVEIYNIPATHNIQRHKKAQENQRYNEGAVHMANIHRMQERDEREGGYKSLGLEFLLYTHGVGGDVEEGI